MVSIKLCMLTKWGNSVHSSNNANISWTLGRLIPEATEQNLIKFIGHLYHEVQSTFSVLGDKIFPGKRFYQPSSLFSTQTKVSQTQTNFTPKHVLKESFAHSLTRYHTQITTFFLQVDDLDDFQKLWKTLEKCKFLHVRWSRIRVKFSNVLYRFPVCYIMLNSSAAKSHWKLDSWHNEQELCDFGLFLTKISIFFFDQLRCDKKMLQNE